MRLNLLLSVPYVRRHVARSSITIAGIALGVAVFVGMHTASRSVVESCYETVNAVSGKVQLQVSASESGLDESVLERVQSLPEVEAAAPVIEAIVEPLSEGAGSILILAVDMLGDGKLRDYALDQSDLVDDPLLFLAQPDSLLISISYARKRGLKTGNGILLSTMNGPRRFTIRGLLPEVGLASAFGGNFAVMDIYAAQHVFGRGRRFDRIEIAATLDAGLERCQLALQKLLGAGYLVEPPAQRSRNLDSMLAIYNAQVRVSALFALFLASFIVYQTLAISVSQRRTEIGILRALGASQGQVQILFIMEAAMLGLVGSAIGCLLGFGLAGVLRGFFAGYLAGFHGMAIAHTGLSIQPGILAGGFLLGCLASVAGAWLPARVAAATEPVTAMRRGVDDTSVRSRSLSMSCVGATLVALGAFSLLSPPHSRAIYLGYFLVVAGAAALAPFIIRLACFVARPVWRVLRPVEGALAADSVRHRAGRNASAAAGLMLSTGMVLAVAGIAASSRRSVDDWMDGTMNPDLLVSASPNFTIRSYRFPESVGSRIAQVPGVEEVQPVRSPLVRIGESDVQLQAVDATRFAARLARSSVPSAAWRYVAIGQGLLASEILANRRRLQVGDSLSLDSPSGLIRLPVVGIIPSFSNQQGEVVIDRSLYKHYWQDPTVDHFRVFLSAPSSAAAVRSEILTRLSTGNHVFVFLQHEFRDYVGSLLDRWFGMTYVQVGFAVFVAVLGIAGTISSSILDRRSELATLKAVGGTNFQLRITLWLEALLLALVGLVAGYAFGVLNLLFQLRIIGFELSGMPLTFAFPWKAALWLAPLVIIGSLLAATVPAVGTFRGNLVSALQRD